MTLAQGAAVWGQIKNPSRFIATGETGGGESPAIEMTPELAAKIASIKANGGRLIINPKAPSNAQQ